MSNLTFNYGGEEVTIHKSTSMVAVKKKPSSSSKKKKTGANDDVEQSGDKLGNFELVVSKRRGEKTIDKALEKLRAQDETAVGTHVYHFNENSDANPLVPNGKLYLVFYESVSDEREDEIIASFSLAIREKRGRGEYIVSVTTASPNPIKCAIALQQLPEVSIAEPSLVSAAKFHAFKMPSDSMLADQWHLRNIGVSKKWGDDVMKKGADAKVVDAWQWMQSLGNPNIRISVSDDGFDVNHPDLKGDGTKVVAPWDFESNTSNVLPRNAEDDHGTSCAGVALAAANNLGVLGAAPNARLMPMRFKYIGDDEVEAYFKYATDNKAHIMSCSWGMSETSFKLSTRMYEAIRKAAQQGWNGKGIVVCYAAGNEHRPVTGFATHPDVICVTSSNSQDVFSADYSNYGPEATICAPSNGGIGDQSGAGVSTTFITEFSGEQGEKTYTDAFGGTSSACPLIAGICGLILSVNPTLTSRQVREVLAQTADKIGDKSDYNGSGHSHKYGYGRVNALKAVQLAATMPGSVTQGGGKIEMPIEVIKPVAPPKPAVIAPDNSAESPDNSQWDTPMATVNVKELNVRVGAGTNFPIQYKLSMNSRVEVQEVVGKWVRIGQDQWVFSDYLLFDTQAKATAPVAPAPKPPVAVTPPPPKPPAAPVIATKRGVVTVDGLNVRSGAGTSFAPIRKLAMNANVTIFEKSGDWYRIGSKEWVFAKYIAL